MVQLHAEDAVARLEQRVVHGGVGLRAGVRLDVHVLGAEQLLRAVDRQALGHVHVLAAAVVAPAGVALGVLVGEHRPLAVEDRLGHEVLGGDHLERGLLAGRLVHQHLGDLRVHVGDGLGEEVGPELGHREHRSSAGGGSYRSRRQGGDLGARERSLAQHLEVPARPRTAPARRRWTPCREARPPSRTMSTPCADPPVHGGHAGRVLPAARVGARLEHRARSPRAAGPAPPRAPAPAGRGAPARGRRPAGSAAPGSAARP